MTKTFRSNVMGTRVSSETKKRFAALAARHHLSASVLLAKMVDEVLEANDPVAHESSGQQRSVDGSDRGVGATDRIALRLRHGDRALAAQRAGAREMKTASYLSMLIHNHVRASGVLPPNELDQVRAVVGQLAALGRQLRLFGMPNNIPREATTPELSDVITLVRREVELAREVTAAVVRRNLISWETGDA